VLPHAGGMPRRSVAAARQRVAGGARRVVALGGMIAAHISRSRGPARVARRRSDRLPPQPGPRLRVRARPGRP
jgi:hypothetical protein